VNNYGRMLGLALAVTLLAGTGWAARPALAQTLVNGASAEIRDAQGTVVGTATLAEGPTGVSIQVQMRGFTAAPGEHGIHIHAVGVCEGPGFTTAGGHFNPASKKHGLRSPEGAHGGDLLNLILDADGSGTYTATNDRISLAAGAVNSIFDADGSAIVIHAGPDDYVTDPSGNSGARIACGVFQAAQVPSGMPRTGAGGMETAEFWLAGLAAIAALAGLALRRGRRQQS
jgi:superoxide dismutase, Cu-Zn family